MDKKIISVNGKVYELTKPEIKTGYNVPDDPKEAEEMFNKLFNELSEFRQSKVMAKMMMKGGMPPPKEALQTVIDVWAGK